MGHFFKAGDGAKVVKLISKDAYAKDVIAPIVEEFRSVADKFTAPKIFFWVEPLQEYTMNQFGFDPEQKEKPLVGFLDQGTGQKYRMEGDFSATTLETFVKGVESGEIAAYSKSEALPDPPVEGKVAKIVGKNFKEDRGVLQERGPARPPGGGEGRQDRGEELQGARVEQRQGRLRQVLRPLVRPLQGARARLGGSRGPEDRR